MISIAGQLGVKLEPRDIEVIHRLPTTRKLTPAIIVQFASRKTRNDILRNKNKKIVTNKSTLECGFGKNQIYLNESLSKHYKDFIWKAKTKAKEQNFKFCRFRNSKILMKESEEAKTMIVIKSENDLDKIKKSSTR